jgi:hypothetical protein
MEKHYCTIYNIFFEQAKMEHIYHEKTDRPLSTRRAKELYKGLQQGPNKQHE